MLDPMNERMRLLVGLAVCLITRVVASIQISGLSKQCYTKPGDVSIGLIIPATEPDSAGKCTNHTTLRHIEMIEAFVYGINEINANTDLLPNVTLGFVILDTCDVYSMTTGQAMYLIPDDSSVLPWEVTACDGGPKQHYDVIAAVGDDRSYTLLPLALVLTAAQIPVIGTYQTSDELCNQDRFGYLVRLSPPDKYQTQAILQLLAHHNWTYFTLIYEEGSYGENGAKHISKNAASYGLCVEHALVIYTYAHKDNIADIIRKLDRFTKSRAIVLFMLETTGEMFFKHVPLHLYNYFIWIGSDGLESGAFGAAADGILTVNLAYGQNAAFEEYYRSLTPALNPDNPWFDLHWPEFYGCYWTENMQAGACTTSYISCQLFENTTAPEDMPFYGSSVKHIDALYTLAHGLHSLILTQCAYSQTNKTDLLNCIGISDYLRFIKNVSFQGYTGYVEFDASGEIKSAYIIRQYSADNDSIHDVGQWHMVSEDLDMYPDAINWSLYRSEEHGNSEIEIEIPLSICSAPCQPRQYYIEKAVSCCWTCHYCRNNEIVINNDTSCEACSETTWPDEETATTCEVIPPVFLQWSDVIGVVLLCLQIVGLVATSVVSLLLIKHKDAKLIKASSRELMAVILVGITVAFLSVSTVLLPPTSSSCFLRDFGFSISVTIIYAPLLVKTVRVYRIFMSSLHGNRKLVLISQRAQLYMSFTLISFQVMLTTLVSLVEPSRPVTHMPVLIEKYTELFCTLPVEVLMALIVFNLVLLLTCGVFGFLTRKLPENFNESWFIFVSVSTTIFLWVAFFPTYFSSFYAYHKAALLGLSLVLNGYITLLCLFVPKLYALYFVEDEKLKLGTMNPGTAHVNTISVAPAAAPE